VVISVRLLLVVAIALVLAMGAVGWLVLVPRWPAPTGQHAVGRIDADLRDAQGRAVSATVWYPATGSRAGTQTVDNAPIETGRRLPLILYSPGWGGSRLQSSIQTANLASHGFVVVACDDHGGGQGAGLELSSDAAMAATIERAGQQVVAQANRLLDVLRALEAGQSSLLKDRIDFARVGVLGYSLGGAAGLQAALLEPRIVGVFSVDGGLFGPPATQIGSGAYFLLSSREAFPSDAELASTNPFTRNYALISAQDLPRNARRMERPDNYWAVVDRADHGDLSDQLFVFSRHKLFRTNAERQSMNAAIEALEVAFFRAVLLGEPGPLRELRSRYGASMRGVDASSQPPGTARARP
jgi:dienelactone hydrolase